jgi:hypothetical protein
MPQIPPPWAAATQLFFNGAIRGDVRSLKNGWPHDTNHRWGGDYNTAREYLSRVTLTWLMPAMRKTRGAVPLRHEPSSGSRYCERRALREG